MDDCLCELDFPEPDGEESWHYTRTCGRCGGVWGALHCSHEGAQNPCPHCGRMPPGVLTPLGLLGRASWF